MSAVSGQRILKVIIVVLLAGGAGWAAMRWLPGSEAPPFKPESAFAKKKGLLDHLYERYGKPRYSQHAEETIARHFFGDRRGGFFLDVGSADPVKISNTYYLEKHLGWGGIAIDAIPDYAAAYRELRPNTRFFAFFVSDKADDLTEFFVNKVNPDWSTRHYIPAAKDEDEWVAIAKSNKDFKTIEVKTVTLDALLARVGVEKIDYLTMDIERYEPQGLAGFDIERYRPDLVCIEVHKEVREAIYSYFAAHGYVELKRYSEIDPLDAYFSPKAVAEAFLARDAEWLQAQVAER